MNAQFSHNELRHIETLVREAVHIAKVERQNILGSFKDGGCTADEALTLIDDHDSRSKHLYDLYDKVKSLTDIPATNIRNL